MAIYNSKRIKTKKNTEWIITPNFFYSTKGKNENPRKKKKRKRKKFEEMTLLEKAESIRKKKLYYENKKYEIRRMIDLNFNERSSFLTLTFKENLQEIEIANKNFTNFMKRLKNFLKKEIKYIATWERQERGAIHYHLILFDFPFVPMEEIEKIWGYGFICINEIKSNISAISRYVSKYFTKDLAEKKLSNKRSYFYSLNLEKPVTEKLFLTEEMIEKEIKKDIIYKKEFEKSNFLGIGKNGEKIFEKINAIYLVQKA